MKRDSLDNYDVIPEDMLNYLRHYGRHFNKKLYEFAVSKMSRVDSSTGKLQKMDIIPKAKVDELLDKYKIKLDYNELYDYVYVAAMGKADYLYDSVPDEHHLAKYIKNVIDDPDGYDGLPFTRWYADMCRKGIPIEWSEML